MVRRVVLIKHAFGPYDDLASARLSELGLELDWPHPHAGQELMLKGVQVSSGGVRGTCSRHGLLIKQGRLHRTLLDEHFRVEGRKKWYATIEEMQADLDAYLLIHNTKRPHQGRAMNGRTPQKVFKNGLPKKENARTTPTTKAA